LLGDVSYPNDKDDAVAVKNTQFVLLKMGIDEQPPPKLEGTYTANGTSITFTLVRT